MEKHLNTLEYLKILDMLVAEAPTKDVRKLCLEIRPEKDRAAAEREMNKTQAAWFLSEKFGAPSFSHAHDISNVLSRAEVGAVLSLKELLSIADCAKNMRSVSEWRAGHNADYGSLLPYFEGTISFSMLEKRITEAVESEESLSDRASETLFRLRRRIVAAGEEARRKLEQLVRSKEKQKYLQDTVITQRSGRFVVPVKAEHRAEIPGLVHDTSASGATLFIEPHSVVEANNEIRILESKAREEEERIISELSALCGEKAGSLSASCQNLLMLALFFTKAQFGRKIKGTVPLLSGESEYSLEFKRARHPLIDPLKAVPIDLRLGGDFDLLVITGPNTGGKTVAIKTLGLLSLMAASGMMIPAAEGSRAFVFRNVLCDIGDEQSIAQSLSTFSSHMKNIAEIVRTADSGCLILLDELGAGTDPVEGAALAEAILLSLKRRGALVATTTHYAELKAFALGTKGVMNASCEFDTETLSPTYRLIIGALGKSNAFLISSRLGLEQEIIKEAEELVTGGRREFENIIGELESRRVHYERKTLEAEKNLREAEKLFDELQRQREQFAAAAADGEKKILEKAAIKAQRVSAEADSLFDEIQALRKQKTKESPEELLKKARASLLQKSKKLRDMVTDERQNSLTPATTVPSENDLKTGVIVFAPALGMEASVTAPPDSDGMVGLSAGAVKIRLHISELRLPEKRKQSAKSQPAAEFKITRKDGAAAAKAETRIDLRGMASDEAIIELDSFIDSAVMSRLGEVIIVHGKGTGVLRSTVSAHLRRHPSIRTFRLGVFGEGENGVTIAEIKR